MVRSLLFAYWALEFAPPGFNPKFSTLTYPETTDAARSVYSGLMFITLL